MNIQEYLDKRDENNGLDLQLRTLSKSIIKEVTEHQKRVIQIMPEFDLHDEKHLSEVEEIIAKYIGDDRLKRLSSIDLFLLIMAAWLHDCGMAPADWELNLMELTEGIGDYHINKDSICHDTKPEMKYKEAYEFVLNRGNSIYGRAEDIASWIFGCKTEEKLISYLANELIEYQKYRNGYSEALRSVASISQFETINTQIRASYIRKTHPRRAEQYIQNLETQFYESVRSSWVKKLLIDLSHICRAHGEELNYVESLPVIFQYKAGINANPQFVAMMLRLGDIVQYSEDRAPNSLRHAILFNSDYSHKQWLVKDGLNYEIEDGAVTYSAFCETPSKYYQLQDYLDWVDDEITNFRGMQEGWNDLYKLSLKKVVRENITFDTEAFTPARGKKFRLEQNNILQMLMGLKLYNSEYDAIRELYQNALDACRCMMSRHKGSGKKTEGFITFGIDEDDNGRYLYCKDNGIGMTSNVIENYLLNIGSSYYKSNDFHRKLASWNQDFVPVSQFGIGILSCFMIGTRLSITSKSEESKAPISCCIEGPTEYFYYIKPKDADLDELGDTGTLIKVYLKEKYRDSLDVSPIEKIGLVMQYEQPCTIEGEFSKYNTYYERWNKHLFKIISAYISTTIDGVHVGVHLSDNSFLEVFPRPMRFNFGEYGLEDSDSDYINFIAERNICDSGNMYVELQKNLIAYPIKVKDSGIEYKTLLSLPLPGAPLMTDDTRRFYIRSTGGSSICIDGITVADRSVHDDQYTDYLAFSGTLNFIGSERPALSVNRTRIVSFPNKIESISQSLCVKVLKKAIECTINHINKYNLSKDIDTCNQIWDYIFKHFEQINHLFVNCLSNSSLASMNWPSLEQLVQKTISIKDFMDAKKLEIRNYNYWTLDTLAQKLVFAKFITADSIEVTINHTIIVKSNMCGFLPEEDERYSKRHYVIKVDKDNGVFDNYDIISNLYPLVSACLFHELKAGYYGQNCTDRVIILPAYSNSFYAFCNQDSRLVHPSYGMYISDKHRFGHNTAMVHRFESKVPDINLLSLEERFRAEGNELMITAYISPRELSIDDQKRLNAGSDDHVYLKGLKAGWSILTTGKHEYNLVIKAGKKTRQELVKGLPDYFWEHYKEKKFVFIDGTDVKQGVE